MGQQQDRTIDDALKEYERHMREKGNKPKSITETTRRLRLFFPDLEMPLAAFNSSRAQTYYDELCQRPTMQPKRQQVDGDEVASLREQKLSWRDICAKLKCGRSAAMRALEQRGQPEPESRKLSVDSHRNMLAEAKSFTRWCTEDKRWLKANPLEAVKGKGKRKHGKLQLRIDETRKWVAKALELAGQGEEGAIAALLTLYLNLRCSEVVTRVARDVDDNGRVLWVPDSKTEKGKRTQEVPPELRPFLLQLTSGKTADAKLFGCASRDWPRHWVQRICALAGVPVVCAHGMRGTHSSIAHAFGFTSRAVADAMGHESEKTTIESYTDPSVVANAQQKRMLQVLNGGRA
ncbi:MAG: tyrosine-type recombinase/integrase [Patescibacteria group bacterium]